MNNFNCLEKALAITAATLAIYQWCSPLGIALAVVIIICLFDAGNDDDEE